MVLRQTETAVQGMADWIRENWGGSDAIVGWVAAVGVIPALLLEGDRDQKDDTFLQNYLIGYDEFELIFYRYHLGVQFSSSVIRHVFVTKCNGVEWILL